MVQGPSHSIEELLPAYALNALDEDERDLVERALAESPRYRAALAEYLEGFARLAESQVVLLPSLDLRDRIMAAAGARGPARLASARVRPESRRAFGGPWAAAAAFVLVFLGLGGLAMTQSFRVNNLEDEMSALSASAAATQANLDGQRAEMVALQESAAETETKLIGQQEVTYLVADEDTSLTHMWPMGTPGPTAKAARGMLISQLDGGRLLMTLFLRPLESSLAYQAWVWESGESAFSIAVFAVDYSGYALVPVDFPGSDVRVNWVSVNVAPAGGEETPTGSPVLVGPVEYR